MTIKGRWLEVLSFTTGQRFQVITEPGQLIIRITPPLQLTLQQYTLCITIVTDNAT